MGKLFGTDGIRGVANRYPMTAEIALKIGKATAYFFNREGHVPRIIVGKDTRISGYMLENALVSGICSMGVNAILIGPIPTPGIAFLIGSMKADAGIMISASHNPFYDNGIKIFSGNGTKLPDEKEMEIEGLILSEDLDDLNTRPDKLGRVYKLDDARGRYIEFLKDTFPKDINLEGTKVVLDCANGATYKVAPETFFELGADVTTLFHEPNGKNINLDCGSQHPESLSEEVVKRRASVGFAFDGDGDRVIAVDEKGNIITGDRIMAICSGSMKKEGTLSNNLLVSTVMSNIGLNIALKELGIDQVITKVGDRYVLEKMQERGASIGGEDSGHLIFLRHHATGDGIITALQILAVMKRDLAPLSELAKIMKVYPQMLINIDVKNKPDISTIPEIMDAVNAVEEELGDRGRVLVRYSGTQPMCRVMVEGPTHEVTERCCKKIAEVVKMKLN